MIAEGRAITGRGTAQGQRAVDHAKGTRCARLPIENRPHRAAVWAGHSQVGRFAPRDTIVLHPYGRYSNAFKFAGEVDVLEALAHAKANYRIDDDRGAVRGFSLGGAGCWQMAVHYPDLFFAANPGAGFSETPEFLKFFQSLLTSPGIYA